jgi:hypothetical protein
MTQPPSTGWRDAEEARERAREIVSDAFARTTPDALPIRHCPNCGFEASTLAARCPECEKRYDRRLPWLKDWMRWTLGALAAAALITTIILVTPGIRETKSERAARLAREKTALIDSTRARMIREQRPVRGVAKELPALAADATDAEKRAARRALVVALEQAIYADAQVRIKKNQLDGPVRFVECGPLVKSPDGITDDETLTKKLGRYDCVGVKTDVRRFGRTVALFGHPYVGTVDFTKNSYVFCKDNKVPGERGQALAKVMLKPECLGLPADAEVVRDGYILPDE